MITLWHRLGLLSLILFVFQGCSAPEALQGGVYGFSVGTPYFYDVQLVLKEVDDLGRHRFVFDVVISSATDPAADVNYSIRYSTLGFVGVCRNAEGTVTATTKHFRTECLMPKPDDLFLQVNLSGPGNETIVEEYRF